jgi:S1-C subfamily serine protease
VKLGLACALVGACGVAVATYAALGLHAPVAVSDPVQLRPGTEVTGALDPHHAQHADFVLDVPVGAVAMRFDIAGNGADLTASLRFGQPIDDDGEADFLAFSIDDRIPLRVSRQSEPPIRPGRWYLRVESQDEHAPIGSDGRARAVTYRLDSRIWRSGTDAKLAIGERLRGEIPARGAGHQTIRVDVPRDSPALRIDVVDTDADVDLHAAFGAPAARFDGGTEAAVHVYGRETLILAGRGGKALRDGAWYVDVVAPLDDERPVRFELLATLSVDPPAELLALPDLARTSPRAAPELACALASVVELSTEDATGSGTFVGDGGWILTNAHVVEGVLGQPVDEVVIGCTLAPERPAVELFRGVVEQYDQGRDLALVRVSKGFYGQSIRGDYRFPTLEFADADALLVGAPLWLVGYPATGGEGSRVTIHATRGIVAGFEHGAVGDLIKTDASITQGNSGGAAVDAEGKLVGIPTSTVENGSGQSGFVRPVGLLPQAWRERIARPR